MSKRDIYSSFAKLDAKEKEGVDFGVHFKNISSSIAIIAPHGGTIEPRTSNIAREIAQNDANVYCFEGLKRGQENRLHITSHHFDEPRCLRLIRGCQTVVAIHGCDAGYGPICIGGLDEILKDRLVEKLRTAKFEVRTDVQKFRGREPNNICNRGRSHRGVQFELSPSFRRSNQLSRFVEVIRSEIF